MSIRNLAKRLPYPVKHRLKYIYRVIPLSFRYGKVFWDTYKFLQKSQWWSKEKLEEYQMQQLEKLLAHSYENVPYYRRIFNERDLKPKDIKSIGDLRKLSYLTKDIIRENLPDLIAQNYPKSKLKYVTTSGTTGIPLGLYWEKGVSNPKEWAFVWRQWNWARFRFGEKRVILRGNVINRFKDGKRQWSEYNPINKALYLSSYDMTDENLHKYIEQINKFKPVALQGYPSSLYILANFLRNNELILGGIKCILTCSETLYPHQREMIEKYLGAKIYDHYGNSERNALIMQCEKGGYHVISEYGVIELIDNDNNSVNKDGEVGEIIATGFNNYAMPFIRYKTGDLGIYSKKKCLCGRNYPLVERIEGRVQEFIVAKDGSLISLGPALFGIHDDKWSNIKQIQFLQKDPGNLTIQIVKNQSCSENEISEYVLKLFKVRFEGLFKLKVNCLDDIPRTKSGKHKYLVQEVPIEWGD